MIRFRQVVVSTRLHPLDDFFGSLSCCKQNNIRRYSGRQFSHPATNLGPLHLRHHPIEYSEPGRILFLRSPPCLKAVHGCNNLVAPISEVDREDMSRDRIILSDQYSHCSQSFNSSLKCGLEVNPTTRSSLFIT